MTTRIALAAALLLAVSIARAAEPAAGQSLVAVLTPTQGNTVNGVVVFEPTASGVHVAGVVGGLEPGSKHGFHVHEFGDCSAPDATSAGDHYSPTPSQHGGLTAPRHAGDLGNIEADDKGMAKVDVTVPGVSTVGGAAPLVGRGLIVHGKVDDLTSQPSGNAGPRVACGVLGVKKPAAAAAK
jgi:Cu-Zn family superoxide dismutase